ncbi:anion permease [Photobacterium leiognathi subsp. mandapamensis]
MLYYGNLASQVKTLGFTGWVGHGVSDMISSSMGNAGPTLILIVMMSFYLLTAYFFDIGTAKVVALGPVIIGSLMALGVNPLIAILAVAGITNIGCNLTTYSHARNEPVGFLPYSFSILILPIFHHDMSLNALKPCDLI